MAWPDKELPAGGGHGRLRASHADRDGVVNMLKSAYVLGLVTKSEFDVRIRQALVARTYDDLDLVTFDLPAWMAAPPQGPVRVKARAASEAVDRAIPVCALFAAVTFAVAVGSDDGWLALAAVVSALATAIMVAIQMRAARRLRSPGGHRPKPGPIDAGPGAAALGSGSDPPRAIELGRAGEVRRQSRPGPHPLLSS